MMTMALDRAEIALEALLATRCADPHWADRDIDVELTTDLALDHIRQMRRMPLHNPCEFLDHWHLTRAALVLAAQAFSRPRSDYGLGLASLVDLFEQVSGFVEYLEYGGK